LVRRGGLGADRRLGWVEPRDQVREGSKQQRRQRLRQRPDEGADALRPPPESGGHDVQPGGVEWRGGGWPPTSNPAPPAASHSAGVRWLATNAGISSS